MGLSIEPYFI